MYRSRTLVSLALLALVLSACTAESPVSPDAEDATIEQTAGTSAFTLDAAAAAPPRYIITYRGKAPGTLKSTVETLGGTVDAVYEDYGFAVVSGIDDEDVADLARVRGVQSAAREPMFELVVPTISETLQGTNTPASPGAPAAAFFFANQWHLPAIGAPAAWTSGRLGSSDVTVAILDTGIDPTHFDLLGRVDLSRSAVFDLTDQPFIDAFLPPGTNPIVDINLHGTHVAAIASSNAFVGAGVTSQTTLMAVKVCNITNACPGAAVLQGIVHAIENGADVINMSLGGAFDKAETKGFVSVINRLFNAAKRAGVTVVVAAGNEASDLDHNGSIFKTYCDAPHVICVSATGPTFSEDVFAGPWSNVDASASYTNFGRSAIDVAAPGGTVAGFVVSACSSFAMFFLAPPPAAPILPCVGGNFVILVAGTSQATPAVSGLAALLVEDFGRNPARIAAAIEQGADDLGQPGTDPFYGKGRINIPETLGID